ncbi:helix-turn-helix transcriptional regulator [candidate division KSB1 bacterium]|nr:helix-turn-helix transcriptional regulator [candidate division KSB1 bacterium]
MNILKMARLNKGFTQWDIEKMTGIWQSQISLFERGIRYPNKKQRKQLSNLLQIKESDFLVEWNSKK